MLVESDIYIYNIEIYSRMHMCTLTEGLDTFSAF